MRGWERSAYWAPIRGRGNVWKWIRGERENCGRGWWWSEDKVRSMELRFVVHVTSRGYATVAAWQWSLCKDGIGSQE
jgi:hypothetical protein